MTETKSEQAARLFRAGLTTEGIGAEMGISRRRVDYHLACYRIDHPGKLPYRVTGRKPRVPSPASWSPERVAFLKAADVARETAASLLPQINALTPGPDRPVPYKALAGKLDRMRAKAGIEAPRRATWEEACSAVGLRFREVPKETVPTEWTGIMRGKPPNHADMVARHVAQAGQSRRAVADVYARGLVG